MNKKVSTLLTVAMVLGGSLLSSSAFAQTTELAADTKLDGSAFYYLGDGSNWLKGEAVKDGDVTKYTKLSTEGTATASLTDANLWSVVASDNNGSWQYVLTNKETGKVLYFKSDGAILDAAANAKINKLSWANLTDKYVASGGNITVYTSKLINISSSTVSVGASGTAIKIYTVDDAKKEASIFDDQQGAFALEYKIGTKETTENIFAQDIRAIEVKTAGDKYVAGTYFVVNPEDAKLKDDLSYDASKPEDVRDLNALTFIAVDPSNDWNINELKKKGEGMKFVTVRGSRLVKATKGMEPGDITANNAAFSVYTNKNNEGEFKLKVTPYVDVVYNEGKDNETTKLEKTAERTIAAVEDQDGIYVTTVATPTAAMDAWASVTQANIVAVADFLTQDKAMVYNLMFTSKTQDGGKTAGYGKNPSTYSEYGKFLGLGNVNGTNVLVAQGPEYILAGAPQNQWIITDADVKTNTFTFTNRENQAQSFTAQLVKTNEEGEYRLVDKTATAVKFAYAYENEKGEKEYNGTSANCDLAGTVVKLVPASVEKTAGYVADELDKAGSVKLSFTVESVINPVQLFVTGQSGTDALSKKTADAPFFEMVKFTADGDTLVQYQDYAYWDAKDKKVKYQKDGDTLAVVTYAFRAVGKDVKNNKLYKNQYLDASMEIGSSAINDAEDAPRFAIKMNADGSYALIPADKAKDVEDLIAKKTFAVKNAGTGTITGAIANDENIYKDHASFFAIEAEVLGNSWKHVPQHVTMTDAKLGGFIAVGEAGEGILAPTTTTADELTFWLDTTNTDAHVPAFYISQAGKFMYNSVDSAFYFNGGVATDKVNPDFILPGTEETPRAVFEAATLKDANTLVIKRNGKDVELTSENGLDNFKFNIVENEEGDYVIRNVADGTYLYNLNGELGFAAEETAMSVVLEGVAAPTANESVSATEVAVIAQDGAIVVKNAAGKNVVVSTILGQVVANEVLSSDNATVSVPAGIVVVSVEGESFKVNVR